MAPTPAAGLDDSTRPAVGYCSHNRQCPQRIEDPPACTLVIHASAQSIQSGPEQLFVWEHADSPECTLVVPRRRSSTRRPRSWWPLQRGAAGDSISAAMLILDCANAAHHAPAALVVAAAMEKSTIQQAQAHGNAVACGLSGGTQQGSCCKGASKAVAVPVPSLGCPQLIRQENPPSPLNEGVGRFGQQDASGQQDQSGHSSQAQGQAPAVGPVLNACT